MVQSPPNVHLVYFLTKKKSNKNEHSLERLHIKKRERNKTTTEKLCTYKKSS